MLMEMQAAPSAPATVSQALARRWDTGQQSAAWKKRQGYNRARKAMPRLSGLSDLGVTASQKYSTWYYGTYLPSLQTQYQVQSLIAPVQSLLQRATYNPYGTNPYGYGFPYGTQYTPTGQYNPYAQTQYGYNPYVSQTYPTTYGYTGGIPYNYQYPTNYSTPVNYGYGYGYGYNPYSPSANSGYLPQGQDQYLYLRSPSQCAGQGGIWDAFSESCSNPNSSVPSTTVPPTGTTGAVPSVLGYGKFAAANMLNAQGYETWLVQEDGGYFNPPQGYDPRRVNIWVSNGVVQRQSLG